MLKPFSYFIVLFCLLLFVFCRSSVEIVEQPKFLNLHDSVAYVGMQTCASCHADIHETFQRTGMGESFGLGTREKSAATYDQHSVIYDSINNFYYQPHWKGDDLFITEYRLEGNDTTHKRSENVKYVVGSGQHTNSHIYDDNGYLRQAPITFYTQKGIWDLAPGFEGGFSSRFNRLIGRQCLSCHNSTPETFEGAENKYHSVPLGIGCERCHGPGEVHVKEKLAGIVVDTATQIDYTIVNPIHLDRESQLNVCGRCHLQGVTVLKDDKDFESWRPGQALNETMEIFLPKYDGAQTNFIMASQAQRMQMSECFLKSEMTCLTCHNPHVSVKETSRTTFNAACINCHSEKKAASSLCTLSLIEREKQGNDCSGCHMEMSGSLDIPHVTITDHFIRIPLTDEERAAPQKMVGLECVTSEKVDELTMAKAYLSFYEEFSSQEAYLDSAANYLNGLSDLKTEVHYNYLRGDFSAIESSAPESPTNIDDAWTAYRIGEAFSIAGNVSKSKGFYEKAVEIQHLNLDFQNKLANAHFKSGNLAKAEEIFSFILSEDPSNTYALNNFGYLKLSKGRLKDAEGMIDLALARNPDYVQAWLNKLAIASIKNDEGAMTEIADRVLELDPGNVKAEVVLRRLQ